MLTCNELVKMLYILSAKRNMELVLNGVSQKEILDFTCQYAIVLPNELVEWLKVCNGTSIVRGSLYGINPSNKSLEIANYYDYERSWKEMGWIPISSDNCGDFYVIDTSNKIGKFHPIYFLDQTDFTIPDYIVASSLWSFLGFKITDSVLFEDGSESYWPFDKDRVVQEDPDIVLCKTAPLPWERN